MLLSLKTQGEAKKSHYDQGLYLLLDPQRKHSIIRMGLLNLYLNE
jgi:hypothetical protein